MLRRFCSYYKYYKGLFALDMSAALISSLLSLLSPAIVRYILSTALPEKLFVEIIWLLIAIIVVYMIQAGATFIRIKWGHYLGVWMENRMRSELFAHLQCLSFSYFDKTKTGTIMSRITNDLFNIAEVAHHCPEDFLISIATIVGAYAFMFAFSWPLALVSIIPLPVMLVYGIIFNHRLKERNRAIRRTIAEVNVEAENSIQGIREVKSYSREKMQEKRFDETNVRLKTSREKMYKTMAQYQTGISFMRDFYYFMTIAGGIILIAVGILITCFVLPWYSSRIFSDHQFYRMLVLFGTATGTLPTGLSLLRVVDPDFETPAARDYAYASGMVFIFVFPLILFVNLPAYSYVQNAPVLFYAMLGITFIYTLIFIIAYRIAAGKKAFRKIGKFWLGEND